MEFVGLISEGETLEQFTFAKNVKIGIILCRFLSSLELLFQKFLFCLERNRICALNAEQKWINDTHFRC